MALAPQQLTYRYLRNGYLLLYATENFDCYPAVADQYSVLDSCKELTFASSDPGK